MNLWQWIMRLFGMGAQARKIRETDFAKAEIKNCENRIEILTVQKAKIRSEIERLLTEGIDKAIVDNRKHDLRQAETEYKAVVEKLRKCRDSLRRHGVSDFAAAAAQDVVGPDAKEIERRAQEGFVQQCRDQRNRQRIELAESLLTDEDDSADAMEVFEVDAVSMNKAKDAEVSEA
jgi:hypothetical protein